jgi:hypothetical protein
MNPWIFAKLILTLDNFLTSSFHLFPFFSYIYKQNISSLNN